MDAARPPARMNHPDVRVSHTRFESLQLPLPSTAIQTIPQVAATTPAVSRPTPAHPRAGCAVETSAPPSGAAVISGAAGALAGGAGSGGNGSRVAVTIICDPPVAGSVCTNGLNPRLSTFTVTVPSFTRGIVGWGMRPTTL